MNLRGKITTQDIIHNKVRWRKSATGNALPLHYLITHGKSSLIRRITNLKSIVPYTDGDGDNALHVAAKNQKFHILEILMQANHKPIYAKNLANHTPFYYLLSYPDTLYPLVERFRLRDHLIDNIGLTTYYVSQRNLSVVAKLLQLLRLNKITNQALIEAICQNHAKLTKILIEHLNIGSDFVSANFQNFMHVTSSCSIKILKMLFDAGVVFPDEMMFSAIKTKNIDAVTYLLDKIDCNALVDSNRNSPLFLALLLKLPVALIRQIAEKTHNISQQNLNLDTALHLMVPHWYRFRNILQTKKLKIYRPNRQGVTVMSLVKNPELFLQEIVIISYLGQLAIPNRHWISELDREISNILTHNQSISHVLMKKLQTVLTVESYPRTPKPAFRLLKSLPVAYSMYHPIANNYTFFVLRLLENYPNIKIPAVVKLQTARQAWMQAVLNYHGNKHQRLGFAIYLKNYANHHPAFVNHIIYWNDKHNYYFPLDLDKAIRKCQKKYPETEWIFLKISIVSTRQNIRHANVLIYDVLNNKFMRFDAYGHNPIFDVRDLDDKIRLFAKNHFDAEYQGNVYSKISLQFFSDENNPEKTWQNDASGFCMAWCFWFLEMIVVNSNLTADAIIRRSICQINQQYDLFKNYIRGYAEILNRDKNKIKMDMGLDKNSLYRERLPTIIYENIVEKFRQRLDDLI